MEDMNLVSRLSADSLHEERKSRGPTLLYKNELNEACFQAGVGNALISLPAPLGATDPSEYKSDLLCKAQHSGCCLPKL